MERARALPWWLLIVAGTAVAAGCGGDEAGDGGDVVPASATAAPSAVDTGADAADTPPMTSPSSEPAPGGAPAECPSAREVGAAYGAAVELDEASAVTGAIGLVFCPYSEVVAPDATGAFGAPAIPDTFSLTFTQQNPVMADGSAEPLSDLGEQAEWSEIGELAVWTGERGLIVSLNSTPPEGDARAAAIALAEAALPPAPDDAEADGTTTASGAALTGCASAVDVGAAIGVDMVVDPGSADLGSEGLRTCLYSAADAEVSRTGHLVVVYVTVSDTNPVQPATGMEEVAGLGEEALWNGTELTVWTGEIGVTVTFVDAPPPGDPLAAAERVAELFL